MFILFQERQDLMEAYIQQVALSVALASIHLAEHVSVRAQRMIPLTKRNSL